MTTFADQPYYEVNREERHFGFLFMASLIMDAQHRPELIAYINKTAGSTLDHRHLDVYAEVSLFRDYWNKLGDSAAYEPETGRRRRRIIEAMLLEMGDIDLGAIDTEDVFWTGAPGSKLFYPGKWSKERIEAAETRLGITDRKLWRLRWLCNAKPDILIEDPSGMVFIEVKVESGFGQGQDGYQQEKTQDDIVKIGRRIIPAMAMKQPILTSLTLNGNGLRWSEVLRIMTGASVAGPGADMIMRHLRAMPTSPITAVAPVQP